MDVEEVVPDEQTENAETIADTPTEDEVLKESPTENVEVKGAELEPSSENAEAVEETAEVTADQNDTKDDDDNNEEENNSPSHSSLNKEVSNEDNGNPPVEEEPSSSQSQLPNGAIPNLETNPDPE